MGFRGPRRLFANKGKLGPGGETSGLRLHTRLLLRTPSSPAELSCPLFVFAFKMGRLAEMQRKLLEVCMCVISTVSNADLASQANDGSRGYGCVQREPPLVRREGVQELSVWDMPSYPLHQHSEYFLL